VFKTVFLNRVVANYQALFVSWVELMHTTICIKNAS